MSQVESTTLWVDIEHLIDQICSFEKPSLYMSVYDKIYQYLTDPRSNLLKDVPKRIRPFNANSNIVGGDVYHHVKSCLEDKITTIIEKARDMTDVDMLQLYARYWDRYKSICKVLNGSCQYVNRHWVAPEHKDGRTNLLEIGPMCRKIWEESFFEPLIPQVVDRCCNIVKLIRNEQMIDDLLLKTIIEILNSQNFNETILRLADNTADSLNVYKEYLEPRLARDIEDFYQCHAMSLNGTDELMGNLILRQNQI